MVICGLSRFYSCISVWHCFFIELKKYYKANPNDESTVSVILGLADGTTYEKEGSIEFVDNKVDECECKDKKCKKDEGKKKDTKSSK